MTRKRNVLEVAALAVVFALAAASCQTAAPAASAAPAPSDERPASGLILDGAALYTVVRGDTLSDIAARHYGAAAIYDFPVIMLASRDLTGIGDPDVIEPGMRLCIPDLQKNLRDAAAAAAIKSYLGEVAVIYDNKAQPVPARELRGRAGKL